MPWKRQGTDPAPTGSGWAFGARAAVARFRFILVIVLLGCAAAFWNDIEDRVARWRRPETNEGVARVDGTEFFCPMHPGVVRAGSGACPSCGMPLSRRSRAQTMSLPQEVRDRVTLSPSRVQQAGIRTEDVGWRPLALEISGSGVVRYDETRVRRIGAGFAGRVVSIEGSFEGARLSKGAPLLRFVSGEVQSAVQSYVNSARQLRDSEPGLGATAAIDRLRGQTESLRRLLGLLGIDPEPFASGEGSSDLRDDVAIRAPFDCVVLDCEVRAGEQVAVGRPLITIADPTAVIAEVRVPRADSRFVRAGLAAEVVDPLDPNTRCPAHIVHVSHDVDERTQSVAVRLAIRGAACRLRPGMFVTATIRVPIVETEPWKTMAKAPGRHQATDVLAVPETAVVDTGRTRVVYCESSPGVFDAREVVLGPRTGEFYPVIEGVEPGMRIAAAGSFLLDAETRLHPAAAGTYFGATGTPAVGREAQEGLGE